MPLKAETIAPPHHAQWINRFKAGPRWHRFWTHVFGKRVPTSGERAHIGDLLLVHWPGALEELEARDRAWGTDANRVYFIGDLVIFDYADTPFKALVNCVRDATGLKDNDKLLKENLREWPRWWPLEENTRRSS